MAAGRGKIRLAPEGGRRSEMRSAVSRIGIGILCATGILPIWAQGAPQEGPRGHWTGTVEIPNMSLDMELDLDKAPNGWIGAVSIPAQNAAGLPLGGIVFANGKWTLRIKDGPGDPTFTATLAADGKSMAGDFTQGGGSFPFKFSRTGDPKIEESKPSPALSPEFVGSWEGTLEGLGLRLVLKMSNEGGNAKAVLISLDQGGVEIPAAAIDQKGSKLTVSVKMVGGSYEGEINKEGSELSGTWTQGGNGFPLKLKKASREKK
jgi:uncharacterized protein